MAAAPASRLRCSTTCRSLRQPTNRQSSRVPAARPYHSYDHPSTTGSFTATEISLLSSAYQHVPKHGFTPESLGLGAKDAGLLDISPSVLPDGVFSLIRYHLFTQRNSLEKRSRELFAEEDEKSGRRLGLGQKVERLTWERLLGNQDVIHQWQEALAVMAQPSHVPASLKELSLLSDEIWFLAGDISVDPSWYTKRASLGMIYSSSELFMTNDRSPEFIETRQFLKRRLENVQTVGGAAASIGQWVGFTMSAGVNVLRSKGVRI